LSLARPSSASRFHGSLPRFVQACGAVGVTFPVFCPVTYFPVKMATRLPWWLLYAPPSASIHIEVLGFTILFGRFSTVLGLSAGSFVRIILVSRLADTPFDFLFN